jgi:hypothetical protein
MEPWLEEHIRMMQEGAAREDGKYRVINENLPSWQEIDDAITNATTIAALKVIIRRMARVVYLMAKNKGE